MSEGLANIAGARKPQLTIDGKVYTLKPMVLGEYAEREAYILSRKPSPFEALEKMPPVPDRPKPIIKGKDETDGEYASRRHEYTKELEQHERQSKLRDELTKRAFKEAMQPQFVSIEEDNAFDNSLHGIAWKLWRALRDNHPEINGVQAALDLLEKAGDDKLLDITEKLDKSEEKDILGNSNGPTTGPAEDHASAFRGDGSTATWDVSTNTQSTTSIS